MDERLGKYENKMQKSLDNLAGEYAAIRAGRANPHILDRVMVDYYGTPTPVAQVGNIAIPEARIITIGRRELSDLFFRQLETKLAESYVIRLVHSCNPSIDQGIDL